MNVLISVTKKLTVTLEMDEYEARALRRYLGQACIALPEVDAAFALRDALDRLSPGKDCVHMDPCDCHETGDV
jgi:hypothetical protein